MSKKSVKYIVKFDSGATHQCDTLPDAVDFAGSARPEVYGSPTEIVRWTRVVEDTYDTVRTIKGEQ